MTQQLFKLAETVDSLELEQGTYLRLVPVEYDMKTGPSHEWGVGCSVVKLEDGTLVMHEQLYVIEVIEGVCVIVPLEKA